MNLRVIQLGRIEYSKALDIQLAIQQDVLNGVCDDTLLLLEHPPVLTMGLRGQDEHILVKEEFLIDMGVDIVRTKRGGDVTYLGPGQIIGYFICNIRRGNRDIRNFVHQIENSIVNVLKENFEIDCTIGEKKYTGVFVEDNKIAAMGFGVSHGVTMHGFALNLSTDLSHFKWIVPCGLHDRGVTSIESLKGDKYNRTQIEALLLNELAENMSYELEMCHINNMFKDMKVNVS